MSAAAKYQSEPLDALRAPEGFSLPIELDESALRPLFQKLLESEKVLRDLLQATHDAFAERAKSLESLALLSREEVAELLKISLSQLDRLTKDGKIPVVYLDCRPRYPLAELREWKKARTVEPSHQKFRLKPLNMKSMAKKPCDHKRKEVSAYE